MTEKRESQKINFTKRNLASLDPPAKGRAYFYDRRTPGLAICVTERAAKSFYFYRRIQGRPVRVRLGGFPDLSPEQARKLAARVAAEIAEGKNPQHERKSARCEMTFGELFDFYLDNHSKLHKKTWREDQQQFHRYLTSFASRKLSTITSDDWASLHRRIGKNNGRYAANRLLALISAIYAKGPTAIRQKANPVRGITRFQERSRERFLEPNELPKFFTALNAEPNLALRDFFWILILTGVRRGGVLAKRWEDLRLAQAEWRLPDSKNSDPIKVHLVPEAVEILNRRQIERNGSDWVFPGHGRTGHIVEPKAAWDRIRKNAELPGLRIHDLRRTLGSWQAATGTSLPIIGKSLGHRSQSATAVYARLSIDPVRESVDRATEAILRAGGVRIERNVR